MRAGWASWKELDRVYRSLDADAAEVRARLLGWVTTLSPWAMGLNIVTAVMFALTFKTLGVSPVRWGWAAAVTALCLRELAAWWRRRGRMPTRSSPRAVRRSAVHAALLAALWAALPWAGVSGSDPLAQRLVASIIPAVIAGGGLALSPLLPAALIFVIMVGGSSALAAASVAGPLAWPAVGSMLAFTALVVAGVLIGSRRAVGALRAERDAERQRQLVAMLLTDFESQSGDVLFETDEAGCLSRVSPKLLEVMQLEAASAGRQSLIGWFEGHCPDEAGRRAVARLRRAFKEGQAFRLAELGVTLGTGVRWWALTARPRVDDDGRPQGWRGVIADITPQRDAQARARELARVDTLTGLANRAMLRERLQACVTAARPQPAALLCLDLDHFRRVNDVFGHETGDRVLRECAARLRQLVRPGDLVARSGGDQFALLLPGVSAGEDALGFARRLIEELSRAVPADHGPVGVEVSVGAVLFPAHGRTLDELLTHADLALEAAKVAGRARAELFRADMAERQRLRLRLERDLHEAVRRHEMRLHWQPKVDTAQWRVTGCEALVRWEHPELGLVSPLQFIPIAEETGFIVQLGRWVLDEACKLGARKLPGLSVAVNASPIQVVREDFVDSVRAALAASGLPPQRLEIEITESLFIDASPRALRNLETLRQMGVRVALDDFGTGYSSLAYLRQFPFDTLKIDRAFVRELVTHRDARAIVRGIVELAGALGMSTVAEGVEQAEQYELLRRAGCNGVQGFLIARPMVIDQVLELLSNWDSERAPHAGKVPDSIFASIDEIEAAADEIEAGVGPGGLLH